MKIASAKNFGGSVPPWKGWLTLMKLSSDRRKVLEEHGFAPSPDCDVLTALGAPLALDARIWVQGEHGTDCSHIFYATAEVDGEVLDGLFYAPSLLEYLMQWYGKRWSPKRTIREVNRCLDDEVRLVFVRGMPMIYYELAEYEWQIGTLSWSISDMIKAIARLDCLLPRVLKRMLEQDVAEAQEG